MTGFQSKGDESASLQVFSFWPLLPSSSSAPAPPDAWQPLFSSPSPPPGAVGRIRPESSEPPGAERADEVAEQAYLVLHLNLSHFLLNLLLFLFLPLLLFHLGLKHSFQPLVSLPATKKRIKFTNEKKGSAGFFFPKAECQTF